MNFPKMESWDQVALWVLIFCLIFQSCCGFYRFESCPVYYTNELWVKVNHVNSYLLIEKDIPFTFPFCEPQGGVEYNAENLGKFITGYRVENSPYRFKVTTNESDIFLCRVESLSGDKFNLLKKSIDEMYQVNLILDNLPAIAFTQKEGNFLRSTSYPIGFKVEDVYYLFNHLKFNVLIHKYEEVGESSEKPGYMVVGFEVIPCSVKHNVDSMKDLKMYSKYPFPVKCDLATVSMPIKEGQPIVFTYEVTFEESDIKWASRSDAYLKVEEAKGHLFAVLNFFRVVTFVAGIFLLMIRWMVRWDFARYVELDEEAETMMKEEFFHWRLVMADVFRTPSNPSLLCVMVGNGIQILGMAIVSLIFAALGFMSSVSRRTLIMGMLLVYMILGVVAGYVAVRLWRTFNQKGWLSIALKTTCLFGFFFSMLTSFNFILWRVPSSVSFIVISILLWFCISVPLTLVGGYFGAKTPFIQIPVQTNTYPCNIPYQNDPSGFVLRIVAIFPSSIIFLELVHVKLILKMSHVIGFLSVVLIHIVVFCVGVSLLVTYIYLCNEDWAWWWKSFFASGSVSLSILIYFIGHLDLDLKSLSDPVFATEFELVILWLGYSLLIFLAIMLASGTVGFFSSFWFVYYLYDSYTLEKVKSQDGFNQNIGFYSEIDNGCNGQKDMSK